MVSWYFWICVFEYSKANESGFEIFCKDSLFAPTAGIYVRMCHLRGLQQQLLKFSLSLALQCNRGKLIQSTQLNATRQSVSTSLNLFGSFWNGHRRCLWANNELAITLTWIPDISSSPIWARSQVINPAMRGKVQRRGHESKKSHFLVTSDHTLSADFSTLLLFMDFPDVFHHYLPSFKIFWAVRTLLG